MISAVGSFTIGKVISIGTFLQLFWEMLCALVREFFTLHFRIRETVTQMYFLGVESIPVMAFSLTFISLMLILEFSFHMKLVLRQDSLVPAFSTVLMLRELGPVVTCLLLMSRVGAAIAAEIGTMKVTEQLDALRLLAIDPIEYLVIPRWVACVFAAVSLSVLSIAIAIVAGASIAAASLGYSTQEYFNSMFVFVRAHDMLTCVVKSAVFGSIIPVVAAHYGFRCELGSRGVGTAATSAVVRGSILIIISDFILTYLLYQL